MPLKVKACCYGVLSAWTSLSLAVLPDTLPAKPPVRVVSSHDIAAWSFGLVFVLSLFFLCVWAVRKMGGITASGAQKMRLLGGLSLGMREKVMLLQVGRKQLILGVTPGRIETLLVLEGEDCLQQEPVFPAIAESGTGFAEKMAQLLAKQPTQKQ